MTSLPFLQHNFSAVVGAIVAVSVLPIVYEVWAARKEEAEVRKRGELGSRQPLPPTSLG